MFNAIKASSIKHVARNHGKLTLSSPLTLWAQMITFKMNAYGNAILICKFQ